MCCCFAAAASAAAGMVLAAACVDVHFRPSKVAPGTSASQRNAAFPPHLVAMGCGVLSKAAKPVNGRGTWKYKNGDEYDGEWRDRKRHGRGKYVGTNGESYEGEYSDDNQHGRGVFTYAVDGSTSLPGCDYSWAAGDRYDGGFKDGFRHGACTYTFFNGEMLTCMWEDGRCPEFTARQRAVQAAPDHASAQAGAQGCASVQDTTAEGKAAAEAAQH